MRTAGVPEELAAMPAGAGLAAVLHATPLADVPNDRMLEFLDAQYRQLCHEQARTAAVLAELSRCSGVSAPGAVVRADTPDRYAPAETRAALRWTRYTADVEHTVSEMVVHGMPELFAAWLAGKVDRARVNVFDRYLTGLTPAQIARICAAAVPRASKLTTGQLAELLRRMVIAMPRPAGTGAESATVMSRRTSPRTARSRCRPTGCRSTRPRRRASDCSCGRRRPSGPGIQGGSGRSAATCSWACSTAASTG